MALGVTAHPTSGLRWVKRCIEPSQRVKIVLQQWWHNGQRGEWRDVETITDENYPLPLHPTNRGRSRFMDDQKVTTKRHNKQHDARAASFKRIAKALRAKSKTIGLENITAREIAGIFDDEAKLLRSMR